MPDPQAEVVIRADDGTEHVFPPGFDPVKAAGIVRQQSASSASRSGPLKASIWERTTAAMKADPSNLGGVQRAAVNALPLVGGVVGGVLGGGPVGAGILGAGGEAAKQLINRAQGQPAPSTPLGAATDIGTQGALMAAGEGIGAKVASGAAATGKWLMDQAVNPTMKLAREFPELSQTMIDNAITVSKGGYQQAKTLLSQAKATANAALAKASATGATVPITAATDGVMKTFDDAVNSSDPVGMLAKLANLNTKLTSGRGANLTMEEADALKTSLQTEARTLYQQMKLGQGRANTAIEAIAKANIAQSLNQAIEDIATKAGAPGYKAANSAAQDLIGVTRAISRRLLQPDQAVNQALSRLPVPVIAGGVPGGGPGAAAIAAGTLAGKAATSPSSLSSLALKLSNPMVQDFLRQLPKPALEAVVGVFRQFTGTAESSSPPHQ